uniref:Putative flavoprotein n=1 Tax=Paulinella chromatophora TaxID=39717 RepID=B1X4E1_PAUCH|nr:putative flavoprotein [Paulinella chromatophora]ACB42810.1 putative flavoprotein [Paulinella chromatophora]
MNTTNSIISLPIEPGLLCLRALRPEQLRFEIEYRLERGTSANSFLFLPGEGQETFLVHPPGYSFAEAYIEQLKKILQVAGVSNDSSLRLIISHINPNRIKLIHAIANLWPRTTIITSNPGAKLIKELWHKCKLDSTENNQINFPELPLVEIIKSEETRVLSYGHRIRLIPTPTPRWPGGLMVFEESTGLLMSGKFFAAHLCTKNFSEINRSSTEEDRRYFYDCLMAPMARQVNTIVERLEELDIRTITPGHGPAIVESWRSLLNDYRRWSEIQEHSKLKIGLIFASAYGNTATIADALAQGISRTKVRVEILNCEFANSAQLLEIIHGSDALLIGSPTLGGHAPTPILSALGAILSDGNRDKPVGIFGSYGWSGEAIDLLESKLRDGGFQFAFDPIRVKFSPDTLTVKTIEETGTALGRQLLIGQQKQQRLNKRDITENLSNSAVLALGRIVGSLCILTARKGKGANQLDGAMVASWVSQASFTPPGIMISVAKDRAVEALLHIDDHFVLNILAAGKETRLMKQFLQSFPPGFDRLSGLDLKSTSGGQLFIPEAMAWLEACVKQRMECNDHWLIYAQVEQGCLLDSEASTAVHQRRSGATY